MARLVQSLAIISAACQAYGIAQAAKFAKQKGCANFDNLPENSLGYNPYQNPVGSYQNIYFQGFVVQTQDNAQDGIYFNIPSSPNVIGSDVITQDRFGGTSALIINTTAAHSRSATFTLSSLRLACLNTNAQYTSHYLGCTVLFEGIRPKGKKAVSYEYEYPNQAYFENGAGPLVDFGRVKLPNSFTGLTEVFLTLSALQSGVAGADLLLDDVCFTVKK